MSDLDRAKELWKTSGASVALCRENEDITEYGRGIAPLLRLVQSGRDLNGFSAADKIVGKAAAVLFVKIGVKEVWSEVMSRAGRDFLVLHGIPAHCNMLADNIINRSGDGICPMEQTVIEISDVETAYRAMQKKLNELMPKTEK